MNEPPRGGWRRREQKGRQDRGPGQPDSSESRARSRANMAPSEGFQQDSDDWRRNARPREPLTPENSWLANQPEFQRHWGQPQRQWYERALPDEARQGRGGDTGYQAPGRPRAPEPEPPRQPVIPKPRRKPADISTLMERYSARIEAEPQSPPPPAPSKPAHPPQGKRAARPMPARPADTPRPREQSSVGTGIFTPSRPSPQRQPPRSSAPSPRQEYGEPRYYQSPLPAAPPEAEPGGAQKPERGQVFDFSSLAPGTIIVRDGQVEVVEARPNEPARKVPASRALPAAANEDSAGAAPPPPAKLEVAETVDDPAPDVAEVDASPAEPVLEPELPTQAADEAVEPSFSVAEAPMDESAPWEAEPAHYSTAPEEEDDWPPEAQPEPGLAPVQSEPQWVPDTSRIDPLYQDWSPDQDAAEAYEPEYDEAPPAQPQYPPAPAPRSYEPQDDWRQARPDPRAPVRFEGRQQQGYGIPPPPRRASRAQQSRHGGFAIDPAWRAGAPVERERRSWIFPLLFLFTVIGVAGYFAWSGDAQRYVQMAAAFIEDMSRPSDTPPQPATESQLPGDAEGPSPDAVQSPSARTSGAPDPDLAPTETPGAVSPDESSVADRVPSNPNMRTRQSDDPTDQTTTLWWKPKIVTRFPALTPAELAGQPQAPIPQGESVMAPSGPSEIFTEPFGTQTVEQLDPEAYADEVKRLSGLLDTYAIEEAEGPLNELVATASGEAETHVLAGRASLVSSENLNALKAFDTALSIDPDNTEARIGRGRALVNLGRPAEARTIADRMLANSPKRLDAVWLKVEALAASNSLDDALGACGDLEAAGAPTGSLEWCRGVANKRARRPIEAESNFIEALNTGNREFVTQRQKYFAFKDYYFGAIDGIFGDEMLQATTTCAVARDCDAAWL